MEVDRKTHRNLSLQNWSFVVLFLAIIGLLAWLSTRYDIQSDWTASQRHTLAEATEKVLDTLDGPVEVLAFAREEGVSPNRQRLDKLLSRYQRYKADFSYRFLNPDMAVDKVREYGITREGELVISYGGRQENLTTVGEQALTNALQRLVRTGKRRIAFLSGHGERRFDGEANHDLGQFIGNLQSKGIQFDALNLSADPHIPEDISALVIASPQVKLLEGEVTLLVDYVEKGGNLLWLSDPEDAEGLEPLAKALGIEFDGGVVVDPNGQLLGISHPAYVLVTEYPSHPVGKGLDSVTLFPIARPLSFDGEDNDWQNTPLLRTLPRSWSERGPLEGEIGFDPLTDKDGPLTIGMLLNRDKPGHAMEGETETESETDEHGHDEGEDAPQVPQQRIAVIGDGDFLANSYLGNGLNQELGERLFNWLSQDDRFIQIPPRTTSDSKLELSEGTSITIAALFMVVIPLSLLTAGGVIWWRRRRR